MSTSGPEVILYRDCIGVIWGLLEKKMETTIYSTISPSPKCRTSKVNPVSREGKMAQGIL